MAFSILPAGRALTYLLSLPSLHRSRYSQISQRTSLCCAQPAATSQFVIDFNVHICSGPMDRQTAAAAESWSSGEGDGQRDPRRALPPLPTTHAMFFARVKSHRGRRRTGMATVNDDGDGRQWTPRPSVKLSPTLPPSLRPEINTYAYAFISRQAQPSFSSCVL